MNLKINFRAITVAVLLMVTGASCKKSNDLTIPPDAAHFMSPTSGTFFITAPGAEYKLPIGVTTVSAQDRTVNIVVSSTTGATEGTEYTLSSHTITIPAGESVDTLTISGMYNQYLSGRKDTLIISIQNGKDLGSAFDDTFTLALRGPCFDGDVTLSDMAGTYANSTDPDDPVYTVTVSNLVSTSATTGTGTIANLWAAGGSVTIDFDWTDPTNIQVSIARQYIGVDYDPGQPISVRTTPGQKSTFSVCNQTISLITDLIVENYFGPGQGALYAGKYPMTIRR
ncbi:MAG: hypothetical protein ABI594_12735 [Ginsengibacter sp.]